MASETKAGKAQDKNNGAEDKEPTGEHRKSCSRTRGVSLAESLGTSGGTGQMDSAAPLGATVAS